MQTRIFHFNLCRWALATKRWRLAVHHFRRIFAL